jgi:NDP-sugar pyrophosphorylase family protein
VCLLVGGRGIRLGGLTRDAPKPLLQVAGRPFVEHVLRLLHANGAHRVVLCVGYLGERFEQLLGDGTSFGLELVYSSDGAAPAGTAGAVRRALPLLGDEFLVSYGDTFLDVDYSDVARRFATSGAPALMTVLRNRGALAPSNAVVEGRSVVAYDKRHPPPGAEWIDYGLLAFRSHVFAGGGPADLADVQHALAAAGRLAAYEVVERFHEIGTPEALAETEAYLAAHPVCPDRSA